MAEHWLLADLGGTNTRVGLARDGHLVADSIQSYANAEFESPVQLFEHYMTALHCPEVTALSAGVAGPVRHGRAQLTNHHWVIDSTALTRGLGVGQVTLMNDLQAQGFALDDLAADHVISLFPGAHPPPHAVRMVMGLGTGSNIAVVHHTSTGLYVPASEAGHISLPYGDGLQAELVAHLGTLQAHRPIETALSGPGLGNIYHWLTGHSRLSSEDILRARQNADVNAIKATELFCQLLGQVAGDLCLAHLPMGGLYFIGGMARAVAPLLAQSPFHERFCAKGPYSDIMRDIPIALITDDNAALAGCARYLRQLR